MKKTLLKSFLLRYLAISFVSLLLLLILSLAFFNWLERRRESEYLTVRTQMIARLIDSVIEESTAMPELRRQLRDIRSEEGLSVHLIDGHFESVSGHRGRHSMMQRSVHDIFLSESSLEEETKTLLDEMAHADLPPDTEDVLIRSVDSQGIATGLVAMQQTEAGTLVVFRSSDLPDERLFTQPGPLVLLLASFYIFIGSVSFLVMAGMYRRLLRPFREITAVADGIIAGDYRQGLADYPEDELQVLSVSINRMVEKLNQLESVRLDFTAQLAHELRTPLSVIRMTLQAMQDGLISKEERDDFFMTALQETHRMEQLTQDLIDLSLAEHDELPLDFSQTNFACLIDSVADEIRPLCESRKQHLCVERDDAMQGQADEKRIRQVLLNLLTNSSKFAGTGKTIWLKGNMQGGLLRVTVEDDGPGIPTQDQRRLFEKYQKQGSAAGAGLGLAIGKEIIEAHGGHIGVESDGASYTKFHWSIPV